MMDMRFFDSLRMTRVNRLLAAVLMVALLAACAVKEPDAVEVGGETYGETSGAFRGQWWNYYERGMSYTEAALKAEDAGNEAARTKALSLAESDLKRAVKMRDKDQRRARTYGMHLIDYFPHRELGIVYYLQARHDEALRELETSLSTVESAKAQFFLDRARKATIDQRGGDSAAPHVSLTAPERVKAPEIEFTGVAEDDGYVASISINGAPYIVPLAAKRVEFKRKIALREGRNKLAIIVADLSGNETKSETTVVSDTTGPSVSIEDATPVPGGQPRLKVKGWVEDAGAVESITIGEWDAALNDEGGFEMTVPVGDDGVTAFKTADDLGNETTGTVSAAPFNKEGRLMGPQFAALDFPGVWSPLPIGWFGAPEFELAQAAAQGPKITVKGLTGRQTVYFDSFYVEGTVSDPSGVQSLVVGSRKLITRPGKKVYFNYLTRLRRGTNRLTFVARNAQGVASQRVVEVTRQAPRVRRVGSRMSVSMLPFHLKGEVNLASVAYEDLLKSIASGRRFNLVDRTQIDKVVRELNLSDAGLTDQASSVKVGKLTQAEVVLLGFVQETPRSIEVYARLVDVESGRILAEKDAYLQAKPLSLKTLAALMDGLSVKIRNRFPMVEGAIASLTGKTFTAQMALKIPLPVGTKFIIFKEKQLFHPETGKPLGVQTLPVAEARIQRVSGQKVSAQVTDPKALKKISKSDKVITK